MDNLARLIIWVGVIKFMKERIKNRTIAIFGIITYILSVLSLVEDLEGNYVAPVALVIVWTIAMIFFVTMALTRLWEKHKIISVLLVASSVVSLAYIIPAVKGFNTVIFIWVLVLLWKKEKQAYV